MEAELRARGIEALYLFGSVARGDARPDSDVDLMADFVEVPGLDLFDRFHLQDELGERLGKKVEVCERDLLRPRVRRHAEQHAVRIF